MEPTTPRQTPTIDQGPCRTSRPPNDASSAERRPQVSHQLRFRELLDRTPEGALPPQDLASRSVIGLEPIVDPAQPVPTPWPPSLEGVRGSSMPAPDPQRTFSAEVLGQLARDVRVATDGDDRFLIRFEISDGALRGTKFAVSSDGGVVSAVAVATTPELAPRLEQVLDEVRDSLRDRGVEVGGMDVRAGSDERNAQADREGEAPGHGLARSDEPDRPAAPLQGHRLDYFV